MKNTTILLLIILPIMVYSQTKTDTIKYTFNQTEYKKNALFFVNKMIEANVKFGNGRKDLICDTTNLEIISHPVFDFKKSIKDDDGKTNLIKYIEFENNPNKQIFEVYFNKKIIYTFYLPDDKFDNVLNGGDLKILFGDLAIPQNELISYYFMDYNYIFRDYFSFYINDTYCVLSNGKISTVIYIAIPEHIDIREFNKCFFPDLNRLKLEAQDIRNIAYEEYLNKGPIIPTVLKVEYR